VDPPFGDKTIPPFRPPPPPQDLTEGSPPAAASDVEQQIVDGVLAAAVHDNSRAAADSFSSAPFVDGVDAHGGGAGPGQQELQHRAAGLYLDQRPQAAVALHVIACQLPQDALDDVAKCVGRLGWQYVLVPV